MFHLSELTKLTQRTKKSTSSKYSRRLGVVRKVGWELCNIDQPRVLPAARGGINYSTADRLFGSRGQGNQVIPVAGGIRRLPPLGLGAVPRRAGALAAAGPTGQPDPSSKNAADRPILPSTGLICAAHAITYRQPAPAHGPYSLAECTARPGIALGANPPSLA